MTRPKGLQELDEYEKVFAALAHETRRHILTVLRARGGKMSAGEIAERFACSWPTVTRHLSVLREASLVTVEKTGREQIYTLNFAYLTSVVDKWVHPFKKGEGK